MNLGFETERIEFKTSMAEKKEAVISMSAMLNKHRGGVVYIGVLPNGEVVGQQVGKDTARDISTAVYQHMKPTPDFAVDVLDVPNNIEKKYIKIVFNGDQGLYSAYERYYIRVSDEDKEMTPEQLRNLVLSESSDYSAWENTATEFGSEIVDEKTLIECYENGLKVGRLKEPYKDKETALIKLGLFREGKLTNAGRYLFGDNEPVQLKLALFATDAKLTFLDQNHFYGNIYQCIKEAMLFVKKHMRWRAEITDRREDIPEVPINSLHEIIVNSFAHARYSGALSSHEIDIFPSKIYIFNPGKLPLVVDPEKYAEGGSESVLKNPRIARVLYLSNSIESFATGFQRVFATCREAGVEFDYKNSDTGFSFEFKRKIIAPQTGVVKADSLTDIEIMVFELIKKDGRMSIDEMADTTGKVRRTIDRAINRLKEMGIIDRNGGKKDGYWIVLKQGKQLDIKGMVAKQDEFGLQLITTSNNELAVTKRILQYDLNINAGDSVAVTVQKGILYIHSTDYALSEATGKPYILIKVRSNGSAVIPARLMREFGSAPLDFLNVQVLDDKVVVVTKGILTAEAFRETARVRYPNATEEEINAMVDTYVNALISSHKKNIW